MELTHLLYGDYAHYVVLGHDILMLSLSAAAKQFVFQLYRKHTYMHTYKLPIISMMHLSISHYLSLTTYLSLPISHYLSLTIYLSLPISLPISHYLSLSSTNPRLSMYYSAEGESGTVVRTDRTIDDYLGWQEDGQDRFRCGVAQQGPAIRVRLLAVLAKYR